MRKTPVEMLRNAMAGSWLHGQRRRPSQRQLVPGEIIQGLPRFQREVLAQLKSDDIAKLDRDSVFDDQATEDAKAFSRLKQTFDAKILRR